MGVRYFLYLFGGATLVVKVIDAMPGAGKTSYAIQMIREEKLKQLHFSRTKRFLYVTPYLDEVERIKEATQVDFIDPSVKNSRGSKLEDLKALIIEGRDIVTTHALFAMISQEMLDTIEQKGYTLIMDEVANVLEIYNISKKDLDILTVSKQIEVDRNGYVRWIGSEYDKWDTHRRFEDIKLLAERGNLILHKGCVLFWTLDSDAFMSFKDVYILTYLFKGQSQRYYYELNGIEYYMCSVIEQDGKYELVAYNPYGEDRESIMALLGVHEDYGKSKLNSNYEIKSNKYSLSSSWFRKAMPDNLETIDKNLQAFFRKLDFSVNDFFWSTLVSVAPKVKNSKATFKLKGAKVDSDACNFVPLNIRATNKYKNCSGCAYIYNRFMNPLEAQFFISRGVEVDEDLLALSDLIQFIFRGAVREGNPMYLYIPSTRMRELLYAWGRHEL